MSTFRKHKIQTQIEEQIWYWIKLSINIFWFISSLKDVRHRPRFEKTLIFPKSFLAQKWISDEELMDYEENPRKCCCSCFWRCMECWDESKFLRKVRKFFTFFFTHAGLILLVTCYCLLGGVIFELIEAQNEIKVRSFLILKSKVVVYKTKSQS